jgi:hypothetical protein
MADEGLQKLNRNFGHEMSISCQPTVIIAQFTKNYIALTLWQGFSITIYSVSKTI